LPESATLAVRVAEKGVPPSPGLVKLVFEIDQDLYERLMQRYEEYKRNNDPPGLDFDQFFNSFLRKLVEEDVA